MSSFMKDESGIIWVMIQDHHSEVVRIWESLGELREMLSQYSFVVKIGEFGTNDLQK